MTASRDEIGPLPPPELATYVLGKEPYAGDIADYQLVGTEIAALLRAELPWEPGTPVLDFGCGSARVLRHFHMPGMHACDIDADCIAWIGEALPDVDARQVGPGPRLPYADGTFEAAYSIAVFSQIAEHWAEWLLELRRVVRPGGRLALTVAGQDQAPNVLDEPWDADRIGMLVLGPGKPWSAGGPQLLHSPWWLRAHWGRAFEIEELRLAAAHGQDLLLLRRPAADVPAPSPAALRVPQPGEPRELAAAIHALELAHRENRVLNRSHDAYAQAYAEESRKAEALRAEVAELRARPRWRR